jgi:hypothetical protein
MVLILVVLSLNFTQGFLHWTAAALELTARVGCLRRSGCGKSLVHEQSREKSKKERENGEGTMRTKKNKGVLPDAGNNLSWS